MVDLNFDVSFLIEVCFFIAKTSINESMKIDVCARDVYSEYSETPT